jgi:hypothetical protein
VVMVAQGEYTESLGRVQELARCGDRGTAIVASGPDLPFTSRYVQASAWAEFIPTLFAPRQFVTMTYRDETSVNSVLRRHGFLVQKVNRKVFGNNCRRRGLGISFVIGVEPQLRGVLHSHAVWDADFVPYDLIHAEMRGLGGHAWVEPVTAKHGVGHYVSKYAVKSGQVHTYLSRQIEALRQASPWVTPGGGRLTA